MELLHSFDTGLYADSVEFCPDEGLKDHAVCACYQLDAEAGSRHGHLLLLKATAESGLRLISRTPACGGVLDLSWQGGASSSRLWCAGSDGCVYAYSADADGIEVEPAAVCRQNGGADTLALSVNWWQCGSDCGLTASYSDGACSLLLPDATLAQRWPAHEFEAWVCVHSFRTCDTVLSGGDDCLLAVWDTRQLGSAVTKLRHNAGVTMVTEHPDAEHVLLSGSYDDHVRAWDLRQCRRPLSELNVGGGVWRLKWSECRRRLLCAAMYNGFKVLNVGYDASLSHAADFNSPHDSIAYGADWRCGLCLTCSFYDHLLCLWRYKFHSVDSANAE